jgi:magnesium and cobalt transporter
MPKLSNEPQGFRGLLREPHFVPETKLAVDLFHTFRERKLSIALTVDEYGGVTGLVTMEDLLECIFGDIHSPSEVSRQASMEDLGDGRYAIDGALPVDEFNEKMGTDLSEEWGDTIGGLLLHHYGELPPQGADLELGGFRFTVMEVGQNRIRAIEVHRIEKIKEPEGEPSKPSPLKPIEDKVEGREAALAGASSDGEQN